ncbi:MAG: Uma2 family endonuclease [Fimbriimonadales bacterium]|nr:Uma2 family endonuclease [Fimbriimonadales bacterium]
MALPNPPAEVELVDAQQVLQLHAIAQIRQLLPRYEATRDPALYAELERLTKLLPEEDGIPMENFWNVLQMWLFIELVNNYWRDRDDYFAAGNVFVYFSPDQAEEVVLNRPTAYRGPDFFVVTGIDGRKPRDRWVVWLEGKYPDLIVELLSDTTAHVDCETKKKIYQNTFRTREYFWYDALTGEFVGLELVEGEYRPKTPNERGWFWSEVLGAWLGVHYSTYQRRTLNWLRLFDPQGNLVPTHEEESALVQHEAERARQEAERAQQEAERARQEAEQERLRRMQLEAELERLRARLQPPQGEE